MDADRIAQGAATAKPDGESGKANLTGGSGSAAEQQTPRTPSAAQDRLFVNEERTVLVRIWASGVAEVARREAPDHVWGPPVYVVEEQA